ncbi:unnamed protein product [Caenorhabditis bovis]|uniref:Phosphatidylinositol-glycan biosynthesis class X protein n=1 Tax=Caenorhabditis bovis TaxID=2654633 RepID=A0A8S1EHR5_9PELO|nr:unnamed protein product [Caenorhabditis bovis]
MTPMVKYLFIFSTFLLQSSGTFGCEELTHPQNSVKMEIFRNGLHRHLVVKTNILSKARFSQCRLLYRFEIPRTMYLDDYALNRSLLAHEYISFRNFDVEKMAIESKTKNVYFIRKKPFLSTFEMKDTLELPIHMRYPPSGD